jgi:TetR/AcrR family transcriptional regulator, lmrAB and yxaGH operons repressor
MLVVIVMPRSSDARQRMIESAALLFRERGVHGTSFSDVLEHSGAPRGSVYHHFSGGKRELAEEATRWAGELIVAGAVAALERDDPVSAVDAICSRWIAAVRASDFGAGCTIVAATLEGDREPAVREVAGEAFSSWEREIAKAFREHGVPAARARSIATLLIASIEGGIVLARAQRSTRPLERVAEELHNTVADAVAVPA